MRVGTVHAEFLQEDLLPLCAGSARHFTFMLLIAWKVCCGTEPACKSCILDETCGRWACALQSGQTLIKYQLALLPYLISCHIRTLLRRKLKGKSTPWQHNPAAMLGRGQREQRTDWYPPGRQRAKNSRLECNKKPALFLPKKEKKSDC